MKVLTFLVKSAMKLSRMSIFLDMKKNLKSNLVVVVVFILESKAGIKITAGQQTMSGLIAELTVNLSSYHAVMLTGHI